MSDQIQIPRTIEEATESLNGLGALLVAKEWQRAAIVYAFTEPLAGGPKTGRFSDQLGYREFAALGIAGLRHHTTVAIYRNAWQTAVDARQAVAVAPGDVVELPTRDWPPTDYRTGDYSGRIAKQARGFIRDNPDAIREIVKDDPALIAAVAEQVADHIGLRSAVNEKQRTQQETVREQAVYQETHEQRDYSADLRAGVNRLMPVLHAMRAGKWQPDVMEQTLISFLAQLFTEIVEGNADSTDVINEIEAYLGAARA